MIAESIVIGTGIFTVGAFGAALWHSAGQSSFFYANARMVTRSTYLLKGEKLSQLASSRSLPDLVNQLKDTEYYPFLESVDKNSLSEFNSAVEQSLIRSIKDVEEVSPKKFKPVFTAYSKMFEATIIKTFFRSRFSDAPLDTSLLEPIGAINPILLRHLEETKTIADMKVVLRDTEYGSLFQKEYGSIEEFDVAIEQQSLKAIDEVLSDTRFYDRNAIMSVFSKRREIREILQLLKFTIRGVEKDRQRELVKTSFLQPAIDASTIDEFVSAFAHTDYEEAMKNALEEHKKEDDYYAFERELMKHYYDFVVSQELAHSTGPYPIISYTTQKKIERRNLLIIAKGVTSGMDKEDIKRMII
jgi:V/A-type H+-transporting ATPase subunit C